MKPTVDNILAKYNIRLYNGSWYVQEKKLREVLEQIIEEIYEAGRYDDQLKVRELNGLL